MREKIFLNWILCENIQFVYFQRKNWTATTDCIPAMINKDILQRQFTKMFDL